MMMQIMIIGGGLAGCEAAWQLVKRNIPVALYEMRPVRTTQAHQTDKLAELVCSNSMRSDDPQSSAVGLLHNELRCMDSLIMRFADANRLPAGSALAVEREGFSCDITNFLSQHPLVSLHREEITQLPNQKAIIATGPLTSDALMHDIENKTGKDKLAFFDAIAPIIYTESLNMDIIWRQSRYDKGSDYLNCPMNNAEYEAFYQALLNAELTHFQDPNTPYFEGCLPIEIMAMRGRDTLRFGPMKPVGLTNPNATQRPYAIVQLRQDNQYGTLYNMVGFQTKMKYGAQKQVFRMIPGLENAEFARLGGIHRNGFLNSPQLLDNRLRIHANPQLQFAGQITGVEGYVESTAMGLIAALYTAAECYGFTIPTIPLTTATGALISYISGETLHDNISVENNKKRQFQPMNANYGLLPPPEWDLRGKLALDALDTQKSPENSSGNSPENAKKKPQKFRGKERKNFLSNRGMKDLHAWLQEITFP